VIDTGFGAKQCIHNLWRRTHSSSLSFILGCFYLCETLTGDCYQLCCPFASSTWLVDKMSATLTKWIMFRKDGSVGSFNVNCNSLDLKVATRQYTLPTNPNPTTVPSHGYLSSVQKSNGLYNREPVLCTLSVMSLFSPSIHMPGMKAAAGFVRVFEVMSMTGQWSRRGTVRFNILAGNGEMAGRYSYPPLRHMRSGRKQSWGFLPSPIEFGSMKGRHRGLLESRSMSVRLGKVV
jgi:hypothetical protein